jgi:MinD superfamily P-loop ATPase
MIKIAIASGKGGTGKTFVATNIFHSLVQNNIDAILVDCDAETPNDIAFFKADPVNSFEVTQLIPGINLEKCTFCGKCQEYCNHNAIFLLPPMKIINVFGELCHGCGACTVACTNNAINENPVPLGIVSTYYYNVYSSIIEARTNIGVMSPVPVIKSAIRQIKSQVQVAILDSPPGTSCPFIQTVSASDYVILVTEPTPFGLSDLKQSIDTLKKIDKPFGVIINRAGLGNKDICKWLKNNNITLLAEVPFSQETARIYSEGRLIADSDKSYENQFYSIFDRIKQELNDEVLMK